MYNVNDILLRIICAVLLQMELNQIHLQDGTKLLCWIKRLKAGPKNYVMRYMCMAICFMKLVAPLMSQICFSIEIAQNPNPKMVIKGYAVLVSLAHISDLFVMNIPKDVAGLSKVLNEREVLREMPENSNKWVKTKIMIMHDD